MERIGRSEMDCHIFILYKMFNNIFFLKLFSKQQFYFQCNFLHGVFFKNHRFHSTDNDKQYPITIPFAPMYINCTLAQHTFHYQPWPREIHQVHIIVSFTLNFLLFYNGAKIDKKYYMTIYSSYEDVHPTKLRLINYKYATACYNLYKHSKLPYGVLVRTLNRK